MTSFTLQNTSSPALLSLINIKTISDKLPPVGRGLLNILADLNIFRQSTCCLVRDEGDNGADNEQGVHNPKSFYFCHRGD